MPSPSASFTKSFTLGMPLSNNRANSVTAAALPRSNSSSKRARVVSSPCRTRANVTDSRVARSSTNAPSRRGVVWSFANSVSYRANELGPNVHVRLPAHLDMKFTTRASYTAYCPAVSSIARNAGSTAESIMNLPTRSGNKSAYTSPR